MHIIMYCMIITIVIIVWVQKTNLQILECILTLVTIIYEKIMHYDVYYEYLYNALCIKALSVTKSLINMIWKNGTLFKITKSVIHFLFCFTEFMI